MIYIILYLLAIVLANLSVFYFGAPSVIINAFLFIGLDLTSRDKLHDIWRNEGFLWKMGLLIASGSFLSWLINKESGIISIASFVAFASSSLVDTLVYHFLYKKGYLVRVNGSNVFSAAVDSLVFPTIAFGGFMPILVLGQFVAKVLGGFVWSFILRDKTKKVEVYNG